MRRTSHQGNTWVPGFTSNDGVIHSVSVIILQYGLTIHPVINISELNVNVAVNRKKDRGVEDLSRYSRKLPYLENPESQANSILSHCTNNRFPMCF